MAARLITLSNTLLDVTGSPVSGLAIPITLIVPGAVAAVDVDSNGVLPDTVTVTTDTSGTYTCDLLYPGDISPAGCVYSVVEGASTVLSPVGFSYSSTISTWQWYNGGGAAGTLKMTLRVVLGNDAPVSGRSVHVSPQQNTIAPDSSSLSVSSSIDAVLDGTGTAVLYLWPSAGLTPTTLYTCRVDGEFTQYSFTVPNTPTGYAGAYDAGVYYVVRDGSLYEGPYTPTRNPPDVVLYGGLYYVCIANTTGHLPTDTAYWTPWLGEPLTWHLQPFGTSMATMLLPGGVAHDTGLATPITGAPHGTPATLADDLENIEYAVTQAGIGNGTAPAMPAIVPTTWAVYYARDRKSLYLSDGTAWYQLGPGTIAFEPVYTSIGANDWLGSAAAIPSMWAQVGGTLSTIVDVATHPGVFSFAAATVLDEVVYAPVLAGTDYHLIARWNLQGSPASVGFLRWGITPTTDLDDGCWYGIDSGTTSAFITGTLSSIGTPPAGSIIGEWCYTWVAIIGGVFKIRVSTDGVTFHEVFTGATGITPVNVGFRFQTLAGTHTLYCNWIQISDAAPSGVTVI